MAASARIAAPPPLRWDGERLHALDQTRLPGEVAIIELAGATDVAEALQRLAVRGAPLIGVAAAYGLAMELARDPGAATLERASAELKSARPTAVNLSWAVDRVATAARVAGNGEPMAVAARAEAEAIEAGNLAAGDALSRLGADLLADLGVRRVMTHCNTGALASGGRASALGMVAALAERQPAVHVLVGESRPLLQGARLTAWELAGLGISHEVIVDAAAAGLLRAGASDAVVVGVDRVAANGDTANKVGTYGLALAARAAGVPFVFAGPTSSIDLAVATGDDIRIEERHPDEVRRAGATLLTLPDTPVRNPAFDVTPAELVSALVTERGVARPVGRDTVAALLR
jgi:methylthioribose-1-phosphate isomerase